MREIIEEGILFIKTDWKEKLFKRIEEMDKEFSIIEFAVRPNEIVWKVRKKKDNHEVEDILLKTKDEFEKKGYALVRGK